MILAVVAVMMLTSACKTSEGTMDRKPIDVGVAIAQRAHNRLYLDTEIIRLALACDTYLATDDSDTHDDLLKDIFKGTYTVEYDSEANVISLVTTYNGRAYATFTTSGGLLREGATWTTDEVYNLTFESKGDAIEVYTTVSENGNALINKYNFTLSNISYSKADGLCYDMDGAMHIFDSSASRVFDATIDETLSFSTDINVGGYNFVRKGFYAGKMNVIYTDTYRGYEDHVTMEYSNNRSILVGYLGEQGYAENNAWK